MLGGFLKVFLLGYNRISDPFIKAIRYESLTVILVEVIMASKLTFLIYYRLLQYLL